MGGGSGGHITPLIAVAKQLKLKNPDLTVHVITERKGRFAHIFDGSGDIDHVHTIFAGKLRRYHGESWLVRIFDIKRNLLNLRDLLYLLIGFFQSLGLLLRHKPNVIFVKGGFVGVPVGFGAKFLRVPYMTHDSDATAGLTNKLIAGGAKLNAVGMPGGKYGYDEEKTVFVGVPVDSDYKNSDKKSARKHLNIDEGSIVLLVTGGSNGAQRLDKAFFAVAKQLLKQFPNLLIIHQVGKNNEHLYGAFPAELKARVRCETFLKPMVHYVDSADLIVARAGATAMSEFAALKKACIFVPNPDLTGGHQLDNAKIIEQAKAAVIVDETEALKKPDILERQIEKLLNSVSSRKDLGSKLNNLLPDNASDMIADLLNREVK